MASIDSIISNAQALAGTAQAAAVALFNTAATTASTANHGLTERSVADVDAIDDLVLAGLGALDAQGVAPGFNATLSAPDTSSVNLSNSFTTNVTAERSDMSAFINGGIEGFITAFVPDYPDIRDELTAKISAGLDGGIAISDAAEQAIYTRSRDRIDAESVTAQTQLSATMARRGFPLPAGVLAAGLRQVQKEVADRAARAATETAVQRITFETDFAKACLGASQAVHLGTQQSLLAYASIVATLNEASLKYASAVVAAIEADVKTKLAVAQAQFESEDVAYKATLAEIAVDVDNLSKKLEQQVKEAALLLDHAKAETQAELEYDRLRIQHEMNKLNAVVSAANAGSSPQASIASSAISSINTTVSEHTEN